MAPGGFMTRAWQSTKSLLVDAVRSYLHLLRIMVPVIILVRVGQALGAVEVLAEALDPLMGMLGLPGVAGLVWATAILGNIYSSLAVYASLGLHEQMSIAQASILGSMLLFAHNVPVEARVAQAAGFRLGGVVALRISVAGLYAAFLAPWLHAVPFMRSPAPFHWPIRPPTSPGFWEVVTSELYGLAFIFGVLLALLVLLRVLKATGLLALVERMTTPVFYPLGLSQRAAPVTTIGMFVGLAYGAALIIDDMKRNDLPRRERIASVGFLSLVHGVIEDTLLIAMLGAHWFIILPLRALFAYGVMWGLMRVTAARPPIEAQPAPTRS